MEAKQTQSGMLSGLADTQLRLAIVAMHERPSIDWTLESLASEARLSRSVFASRFRERVGCTPGEYLQRWRISLAQRALKAGRPLKLIADEVGYGSEAALSRAFKQQSGVGPREWRRAATATRESPP
jgi:transcriptional regulator GlxA family with amidase domain